MISSQIFFWGFSDKNIDKGRASSKASFITIEDFESNIKIIEGSVQLENFKKTENGIFKVLVHHNRKDDLNISGALGELFSWVNSIFVQLDREIIDASSARGALSALDLVDTVLGVMENADGQVDESIQQLIDERNIARIEKNWAKADEVRDKLDKMGILIEDTPEGTIWKKK